MTYRPLSPEEGADPTALNNLGDLPGEPPTVYRILKPPTGTPQDWESLIKWSWLRGTDAANPLSEAIRNAITGEVRP